MREGKGSVYEEGVRVPMMVYWPGKTEAGMRINTPVTPPDFYPSICEMAGVENPETVQKLDGKSFVKLVTDGSRLAKEAVEKGKIRNNGRLELYNLKKDLSEKNDVSAMHPKIVRELAAELSDTLREWEAPMPLVKATGKLVPMPDELF